MDQKSDIWREWRALGIGSSDAPVILGDSPYQTPLELWKVKTGLVIPDETSNFIQQRGNEYEPIARAKFELQYDIDMPPDCMEHKEHKFMRASLDGRNAEQKCFLEIKYLGKDDFAAAQAGQMPERYIAQIQHQFAVTGDEYCYFVGINEAKEIAVVKALPMPDYISDLIQQEWAFWQMVITKTPPPMTDRDYKELVDETSVALAQAWKLLKASVDKATKAELEKVREQLIARADHPRIICAGVHMIRKNIKIGHSWDIRDKSVSS